MAKKRSKRGNRPDRNRPKPPQNNTPETAPDQPEAAFFSPETEQTEHNHTYKFPGVPEVVDCLFEHKGNLLLSAQELGVSRTTLYDWLSKYPVLEEARKEANEGRLDLAESKLDELIEGVWVEGMQGETYKRPPSYQAIQFLLRTLGRARGYVLNNMPIKSNDSASHWDQLHQLFEQARKEFSDDP